VDEKPEATRGRALRPGRGAAGERAADPVGCAQERTGEPERTQAKWDLHGDAREHGWLGGREQADVAVLHQVLDVLLDEEDQRRDRRKLPAGEQPRPGSMHRHRRRKA
jgi:hypothetical protein